MNRIAATLLVVALSARVVSASTHELVPGSLKTSWVGNSFEGAGQNGTGRWVQNFIDEIEVTPDGAVVTCSEWDEAGRCTGIYKDGDVNRDLLKQYNGKGGHEAWGWGMASAAIAVDGDLIYVSNNKDDLMRFRWDPADIHAYTYLDQVKAMAAIGMTARDDVLYAVLASGKVEVRNGTDLSLITSFDVKGAKDLAVDEEGSLWILVDGQIQQYSREGRRLSRTIADAGKPISVSIDCRGRVVVCDDGPRQQVLFYDVTGGPRLVRAFGTRGGLRDGTPGIVTPHKFFALKGANTDADGNIYVALSNRCSIIRKFRPDGELVWERSSYAFVDQFDVYAPSDGLEIYGLDEIFEMDYSKSAGGEWKIKAITRDLVKYPNDPRGGSVEGHNNATCIVRNLEGRRVMYNIGMYAGSYDIYVFEDAPSHIARYTSSVGDKDGGWAWDVDTRGDIWQGEAKGGKIRRYRFQGFDDEGAPRYDRDAPEEFGCPKPFNRIQRVRYVPEQDAMYVSGYTPEKGEKSWGLIGSVIARYDAWSKGNREAEYVIDLPMDNDNLHPKALDIAGEYIFTVAVKHTGQIPAMVHVFKASDGSKAGVMYPGTEVGGASGWVDIPYGIRAFQRSNGEYVVLVEEDWRAKNIMYRWTPPGAPKPRQRRFDASLGSRTHRSGRR